MKEEIIKLNVKYKSKGNIEESMIKDVIYTALMNGGCLTGEEYIQYLPAEILLEYNKSNFDFEVIITEKSWE